MQLHDIRVSMPKQSRRRVGRGIAAGQGKTAGRGTKGQNSRTGHNIPRRFEGGQTPLVQRLPKLNGFRSLTPKSATVRFSALEASFDEGAVITPQRLKQVGLLRTRPGTVKIVATPNMSKRFSLSGIATTKSVAAHLGILTTQTSTKAA